MRFLTGEIPGRDDQRELQEPLFPSTPAPPRIRDEIAS
jgi:hypothetical protein